MARKPCIGVIFGGRSGEHEVSLQSARAVLEAIDRERYDVMPIGITREGRMLVGGDPLAALTSGRLEGSEVPAALVTDPDERALIPLNGRRESEGFRLPDVVFPVLHGTYGEDGTIQGLLELAGVPYVGAGVLGSAAGMDKEMMKWLFEHAGLPVVPYLAILRSDWEADPEGVIERIEESIGYPCFVKPANLGSSVGVNRADERAELELALVEAARYDVTLIVERAVNARELEVSVLGNERPEVSVVGEVVPHGPFYDYTSKYTEGGSDYHIPADLPAEVAEEVRRLALRAFRAIKCAGMARVDFFYERGSGRLFVNEINTIPGFTRLSMYPRLWEASGLPFPALVDRLIELALERHAARARCETTYRR